MRTRAQTVLISMSVISSLLILYILYHAPLRSSLDNFKSRFGATNCTAPQPPQSSFPSSEKSDYSYNSSRPSVDVVLAKTKGQSTSWLPKYFQHARHMVYVVDDPTATLSVPKNKGRESMAYLTYIIDHYDALPEFIFFLHAGRFQWHNDDADFDQYAVMQRTNLDYVRKEGYASLRCVWQVGCPDEVKPIIDANDPIRATSRAFAKAFRELFPGQKVPDIVAVTCCAQFVATSEQIRKRTRKEFIAYRDWVINTDLDDDTSGRVFEYIWHLIFGKNAVHCPDMKNCYCQLFGICGLTCGDLTCDGQWVFPPDLTLPEGWPKKGWEGEDRNFAGPL